MKRIKLFTSANKTMEEKVNEFLDSIDDQDVLDIQFQDSPTVWSVMIVYDKSSFTKKTNK